MSHEQLELPGILVPPQYKQVGYVAMGVSSGRPVRTGGCNRRTMKVYDTEGRARASTMSKYDVKIVPVFVQVP